MKKLSSIMPELYFTLLCGAFLVKGMFFSGEINYIAILFSWLLFVQIIYRNRYMGIAYGVSFLVFSAFAVAGRLISGFSADESIDQIPFLGIGVYSVSFIMSVVMVVKYFRTHKDYNENSLTISF